jgi:hypothetical protein
LAREADVRCVEPVSRSPRPIRPAAPGQVDGGV